MSYVDQLNELVVQYLKSAEAKGDKPVTMHEPSEPSTGQLKLKPDLSGLTPEGARDLHAELCRLHGMSADEIIADWNRRSPEDPW